MKRTDAAAEKYGGKRHEDEIKACDERRLSHRRILHAHLLRCRPQEEDHAHESARLKARTIRTRRLRRASFGREKEPQEKDDGDSDDIACRTVCERADALHADGLSDKCRTPDEGGDKESQAAAQTHKPHHTFLEKS